METLYKPDGVEQRWQQTWEGEGLYAAEPDLERESFVICIPPPNVTGELHMGHALNASIQDLLIRWHRMRGFNTVWQPGYDHAGIATQNVIEKELAKEGLTRHDLGREKFLERTWAWLERYGGVIMGQLRGPEAPQLAHDHAPVFLHPGPRALDELLAPEDGPRPAFRGPPLLDHV